MEELLLKIKKSDVFLRVEDNNLKMSMPEGFKEKTLIEEIKKNKKDLIEYINGIKKKKFNSNKIPKVSHGNTTKLTPPQLRLYVMQGLAQGSNVYNIPFACEINGAVDVPQMKKACIELIQRHESLRTSFLLDENYEPVQKVLENFDFELEHIKSNKEGLEEIIQEFSCVFNLEKAPLFRAKLVEIDVDQFMLLVDVHHIIFDGLSLQVFIRDLFAIYNNQQLPELELQYRDYASWYFSEEYQMNLSTQKSFWLKQLNEFNNTAILPSDFKKSNKISFEGATLNFAIKGERKKNLEHIAKNYETSLFSLLTSFYGILQAKLTGVDDLAIGTPMAGRTHWSLDNMIGMFVNTLAIRMNPKNEIKFADYLKEVSATIIHSFDNQEYPVENLLEDLGLRGSNEMNPLFNTLITFLDNVQEAELNINDLSITPVEIKKSTSKFDLVMHFTDKENELGCVLEYDTQMFKQETIESFFHYFINIIDQVIVNPLILLDQITLLDKKSSEKLLQLNDFTDVKHSNELTLSEVFENQVSKNPDSIALVIGENTLSYRELNNKANKVARLLRAKGVGREEVVGLLMEKNFEVIIGMLGILKAGGAYVPIDVNYPQNRIDYIVENSGLEIVLTTQEYSEVINKNNVQVINLSEAETLHDTSNLEIMNSPNDLCYVIYTSGTTGAPKGVMVEHKNVVRLLFNEGFQFDFTDKDVWTMFHSHCFDFSVWEMYGPLLYGGTLVLISEMDARDPKRFIKILKDYKVTVLNQTPTSFYSLIKESIHENEGLNDLRYVIFGGEALIPSKLKDWKKLNPDTKLINMYGITEVTVHMTYKEIGTRELALSTSNIGKALPTGSIYLLDNNLQPVPIGVIGEIYVGGAGVARGYINNKKLTDSRFINNPFKEDDRLYRSGDLAVMLANGDLEYKGRIDRQVQLKGFRIELKEIEHHLNKHELINDAIVVKTESNKEESFLCSYYIANKEVDVIELRTYLADKLPHYMIPSYFVRIDEMPFTSNNKIDTSKLPEPKIGLSGKYFVAPTNEKEEVMCKIWQKYLGVDRVGILDNFFTLGGDSLKAIALISTMNEHLSSSLVIADIYSYPTIKELVGILKSKQGEDHESLRKEVEEELLLFQETYKKDNNFLDSYEEVYPMNGIEKGMVFHSLMGNSDNINNILYHEQNIYSLPIIDFDFEIFKEALNLLIKKHSEFRKIYDLENLAHIVLKEIEPEVNFIDLCHLNKEEQKQIITEKSLAEKLKATNLFMSIIWRMHIFKVNKDFVYLMFDFNHSLMDGWSLSSFITELINTILALKKNENYVVNRINGNYKDQIIGELTAIKSESSKKYWKEELAGYNRFELPEKSLNNQLIDTSYNFGTEYREKLEDTATKLNTTFKHLCFAAIIYSLRRISYENDITIGLVTNVRPLISDAEELLGCFLNTIPFRAQISEDITWREYIGYIENKLKKLKYHERVPFYKILDFIEEKTLVSNPVFDVKLNYIDFRVFNEIEEYEKEDEEDYVGLSDEDKSYVKENTSLNFHVLAHNRDFVLRIVHSMFPTEEGYSDKLFTYVKNTFDQILEDADQKHQADCLIKEEYSELTEQFNNTKVSFDSETTILDLFNTQVKALPNNVAVTFENTSLGYKELDQSSNQLAHKLITMGVKPETLVPICVDRSLEMIIGILGILKAGGVYVPIDPTYPQNRIDYILEDVQSPFILTQSKYTDHFEIPKIFLDNTSIYENEVKSSPKVEISDTSLAYVIYTSGTTGKPKGVMNTHAGIYNRLSWMRDHYEVNEKDHILQKTNYCFDVSVWELILPLICGSKLVFAKPDGHKNPRYLEQILIEEDITMVHFVPSMLSIFLQNIEEFKGTKLRSVICSGEELKLSTVKKFQSKLPDVGLHNLYGPTEAAIDVTAIELTNHADDKITIGYPIANTQIYIVNSTNEIQPIGVKGELLIGGVQVARGYLNKEELTSEKFIDNPFDKKDPYKLYKTGDMARWRPDGSIEYLGRIDNQVKLRGNRIELGEIENSLTDYKKINTAIVDLRKYNNDFYLIGYYTTDQPEPIEVETLKRYLIKKIPEYMIPSYFVKLNDTPLTSNGKLDRSSLPEPEIIRLRSHVNPSNETEELLLQIWSELLNTEKDKISVETSFFDLGGHSLRVITLANTIFKVFEVDISLAEIFEKQTIKNISDYIITVLQMETHIEDNEKNIKLFI